MRPQWLADRMNSIESSGIRKVFELGRSLKNPINLSIGQPHFDVPDLLKDAAHAAMRAGRNAYTVTQGVPELREKLEAKVRRELPHEHRRLLVTTGTSGALVVAMLVTVNPGDEVIVFDPYFVMYPHLVTLAGGKTVLIDTYPDFTVDVDRVRAAITPRTKAIIVNSPANPTGVVLSREVMKDLAGLAAKHGVLLISDEIYRSFCYDVPFSSPAEFNEDVLVVDGFSKSHAMTGWRLGYAHGPKVLIDAMTTLQQFTYVCAPSMVQWAGVVALEHDVSGYVQEYQAKRDRIVAGLRGHYDFAQPQGAFYLYAKAPRPSATDFVTECIQNNLLLIPGKTFSQRDSHFRLSYAATDETLDRGIEVMRRLAR